MNEPTARSQVGEGKVLLRVAEVADILGMSPRVTYEWIARGVIPPEVLVRNGRSLFVKRGALEAWLAGRNGTTPASDDRT